jgi:hypothetical protein
MRCTADPQFGGDSRGPDARIPEPDDLRKSGLDSPDSVGNGRNIPPEQREAFGDNGINGQLAVRRRSQTPDSNDAFEWLKTAPDEGCLLSVTSAGRSWPN